MDTSEEEADVNEPEVRELKAEDLEKEGQELKRLPRVTEIGGLNAGVDKEVECQNAEEVKTGAVEVEGLNIELKSRELQAIRFEVKGLETGTMDNELEFKESEEVEIEVLEVEGLSVEALELRELETTGLVTESEEGWSIEQLAWRELETRPEAGSIAEGLASAGRLVGRLFVNDQTSLDCHNSRC